MARVGQTYFSSPDSASGSSGLRVLRLTNHSTEEHKMSTVIKEQFDRYEVILQSGAVDDIEAIISLSNGATERVARIFFYKTRNEAARHPNAAPVDPVSGMRGDIFLAFPISRFNDVITTLRQEKPLEVFLIVEELLGGIQTPRFGLDVVGEPVGEEEGK